MSHTCKTLSELDTLMHKPHSKVFLVTKVLLACQTTNNYKYKGDIIKNTFKTSWTLFCVGFNCFQAGESLLGEFIFIL